jgi:transketolase
VLSLEPLAERWRAFGWDVHELDGHDPEGLSERVRRLDLEGRGAPHVLIARTTFGKGVSFMEGRLEWHYLPMSDEQYRRAMQEIDAAPPGRKG